MKKLLLITVLTLLSGTEYAAGDDRSTILDEAKLLLAGHSGEIPPSALAVALYGLPLYEGGAETRNDAVSASPNGMVFFLDTEAGNQDLARGDTFRRPIASFFVSLDQTGKPRGQSCDCCHFERDDGIFRVHCSDQCHKPEGQQLQKLVLEFQSARPADVRVESFAP